MRTPWSPTWSPADVDAEALWADSGAQWLSHADVGVPGDIVRELAGLIDHLDGLGGRLGELFPAGGVGVLAERAAVLSLGPSSRTSCGGATQLVQAGDGWLALGLPRDTDWELLPAWLELDGPASGWPGVHEHVRQRRVADLVARAGDLGLPCSAVGERTGATAVFTEDVGVAMSGGVDGVSVVNLASLWAGPLCADVLGQMGASVTTVESAFRPDGARDTPRFFDALHRGQQFVQLDFSSPREIAVLRELLMQADVVIEGSRPRALRQLGIRAEEITSTGPRAWISITAHGRHDEWGRRVGFGDDAAAAGGLVWDSTGGPMFVGDAIADPLTGLVAAAVVLDVLASGRRVVADVALARVAGHFAATRWVPSRDVSAFPVSRTERGAAS